MPDSESRRTLEQVQSSKTYSIPQNEANGIVTRKSKEWYIQDSGTKNNAVRRQFNGKWKSQIPEIEKV
jgi:hypothetical protein